MATFEVVSTPSHRSLQKQSKENLRSRLAGIYHALGEPLPDTSSMTAAAMSREILAAMRRLPE